MKHRSPLFRRHLGTTALVATMAGGALLPVHGQAPADPFGTGNLPAKPDPTITVIAEWIEVELADLHELTSGKKPIPPGGNEMRKAVGHWIATKRAEVVHTSVVTTRSGQRAETEGIAEVIYPTEFEPPRINKSGEAITHAMPAKFNTRETGPVLEVDPVLGLDGETVTLRFSAEIVKHTGKRSYGKDEAEAEVPDFYKMKITARVTAKSGDYRLAGTFRPAEPMGKSERKASRLMLFVRSDVNPVIPPADAAAEKQAIRENWERDSSLSFHFDLIETDLSNLNILLIEKGLSTRGPELRDALIEAVAAGQATLIDTVVASGDAGEFQTRINSGPELIYPSQWDEPLVSEDGSKKVRSSPAAFETIDLGSILSFQAAFGGAEIDLSLHSDLVSYVTRRKYLKGESEVTFPLNHHAQLNNTMSLWPGEFALAGTVRPDTPSVEGRQNAVIAIFVRGEVVDSNQRLRDPPDRE